MRTLAIFFFLGIGLASFAQTNAPIKDDKVPGPNPGLTHHDGPSYAMPYASNIPSNYIRVWEPQMPYSAEADVISGGRSVEEVRRTTQYFDGLGRQIQTVAWDQSNSKKDIVSPVEYDDYGRQVYSYVPYAATGSDGNFKTDAFTAQQAFLQGLYNPANDPSGEQYFYGKTVYDNSPVNRVSKSFAPGNSWAGSEGYPESGTGSVERKVKKDILVNDASDDVKIWAISNDPLTYDANNDITSTLNVPTTVSSYSAGTLYKTVITDENLNQAVEYKDLEGHIILKKVQAADVPGASYTGWLSTFYVYDDYGNLRFVIPPKAVAQMLSNGNWNLNQNIVKELCYRYEYDLRQRVIAKKIPGAGWTYMVYDNRDNLVYTQDANMRNNNQWSVIFYDALNRPVMTGIVTTGQLHQDLITYLNTQNYNAGSATVDGMTVKINPLPTDGVYISLTKTYYDSYSFTSVAYDNSQNTKVQNNGTNVYAEANPSSAYTTINNLVAGTQTRVIEDANNLSTGPWLTTVNFYNKKSRLIQSYNTNYKGGYDKITNLYDFAGKLLSSFTAHTNPDASAEKGIGTDLQYDHTGKVTIVKKRIYNLIADATPVQTVKTSENVYDELGQLLTKKLGQTRDATQAYTTTPLETMTYEFNVRGWLKSINDNYGKFNNTEIHWFAENLSYDWGFDGKQFNGNIAGVTWRSRGDAQRRSFGYGYDPVNRLMFADFKQYESGSYVDDAMIDYDMKMGNGTDYTTAYDENGNIKAMTQNGLIVNSSSTIDNLTYTYFTNGISNKLKGVTDAAATANQGDFTDKNTTGTDYGYDENGNLVTDLNKNLNGVTANVDGATGTYITSTPQSIQYNYLNLPWLITLKNDDKSVKGTIKYIYDAAGTKLQKTTIENASTSNGNTKTTTDIVYIGGFVYQNVTTQVTGQSANTVKSLQFILHEDGRIREHRDANNNIDRYNVDYFLKDHLGNVRMVITDELRTDIYPAATLEGTYGSGTAAVDVEKNYYTIDQNQIVSKTNITGWTTANDYLNNNGISNPNPNGNANATSTKLYKVNGTTNKTGLGITLKVMTGDKIDIFGKSYFSSSVIDNSNNASIPVDEILSGLLGAPMKATASKGATVPILDNNTTSISSLSGFLGDPARVPAQNKPQAFINYVLFDEQFNVVKSGYSPVNQTSGTVKDHYSDAVLQNINISRNGFLYVYVSNQSPVDVYFDNLQVVHTRGALLEENHYNAFGTKLAGISSEALNFGSPENKHLFNSGNELQNKEFSDGSGLEWYDAKNRMYDAQIGRFFQIDALGDMSQNISPYVFASDNPISINDPLGLTDSSHNLKPVTVVSYIQKKWNRFSNWFTGANVGYNGSGWGHGPRTWLANQFGLGNNANNLWELGMQSMLQNSQVNLTGDLLNKLKTDPAMIAFQNKIIALLKTDPRFAKLAFITTGKGGVEFGGQRWGSKDENWGALNGTNPALHGETWQVAGNALTWSVRHATVDYTATVKADGTIVIDYHLSDRLDLSPQAGRSEAYNNISAGTGFLYHDVAGGNSEMKVNADWQTAVNK